MKFPCFWLLALLLSSISVYSQSAKWEIAPGVFSANYMGDLVSTSYPTLKGAGWGGGLLLRRNLGETISLRLGAAWSQFNGDDAYFPDRNAARGFSFQSDIFELSLVGEWDPWGHRRYDYGYLNKTFSPYFFGGIAGFAVQARPDFGTSKITPGIITDQATSYPQMGLSIPMGMGFRYDLTRKVSIGVEAGVRMPFTDNLDGISASADPSDRDWYMMSAVYLAFKFGRYKDSDGDRVFDKYDQCRDMPGEILLAGCPDTDGDGIIDEKDACPYQRGSAGMMGCPDRDGDGVGDKDDRCPDNFGLKVFGGCPDTDGDSIPDLDDLCPDRYGVLYAKGCPDTDRDSIPDDQDKCPAEAGIVENQGCPDRDKDGDGVVDRLDKCPEKPGLRIFDGCPDRDGDGVTDAEDKCPGEAGPKSNKGCPEVKKEELAIFEKALTGVQFASGKSLLRSISFPVLNDIAKLMKKYPAYDLHIHGHTDSDGDEGKNQKLSEERANACRDYLVAKGVAKERMQTAGFGETQPLVPNTSKANKAKNRRVAFEMKLPE